MTTRVPATSPSLLFPPFRDYQLDSAFDEMFESYGANRPHYRALYERLLELPAEELKRGQQAADQDFAHIMIGLAREFRIPCRCVSGYLYHHDDSRDRSAEGATHAWVEVLLPGFGWMGFDPTNNLPAGDRHIRVAIGRDYSDVAPMRGVFRGAAESELSVAVRVATSEARFPEELIPTTVTWSPISEDQSQQQE